MKKNITIHEKASALDLIVKNKLNISLLLRVNNYSEFLYYNIVSKKQISEEEFKLVKKCVDTIKSSK